MPTKRRRSSVEDCISEPVPKRVRTRDPLDFLSNLSDELLIRILHNLPIETLLQCQRISHRLYTLAGDSQIWKNLYYNRFVLPRARRIPGIKAAQEELLHFSSRKSKWLDENTLINRADGKLTNWKQQYKLRHNWSIGACAVQEINVAARPSIPSILVRLAERIVVTADKEEGLRAWDLKEKTLIAKLALEAGAVPTCLAIDEHDSDKKSLGIAVGFLDGAWSTWKLDSFNKSFILSYAHPASSNGSLSGIAYTKQLFILTITDGQLLSLYTFGPRPLEPVDENLEDYIDDSEYEDPLIVTPKTPSQHLDIGKFVIPRIEPVPLSKDPETLDTTTRPHLLASLKSHTSWPPLSLSIRSTRTTLIASIAYSLPTYLSGYTIGLQELQISLETSHIISSRLTAALPTGFQTSRSSNPVVNNTRPTSLSYSHPYILTTHPDNTLTFYMCNSTATSLSLSSGTKLWGHTSCVSSAEITPRGKAVSVSTRGELRVWELEGGVGKRRGLDKGEVGSVRVSGAGSIEGVGGGSSSVEGDRKRWVGFDDEMVIVLKDSGEGTQDLVVYDFT